jgi:hypothetical protein
MEHPLIHDRGRGPELVGTRTTIYNLVPYFLNPDTTEAQIAEWNRIPVEQVAAMRAYFLAHYLEVMAQHEQIEERIRKGREEQQKPEFQSRFWWNRERLEVFRDWLNERKNPETDRNGSGTRSEHAGFQALAAEFRHWYEAREAVGVGK